jgi:replicative DNA helicase
MPDRAERAPVADIRRLGVPPHSIEAEQALLGSLLISETAYARICNTLGTADFYRADHRTIYAAIATLHGERKAVDAVTVSEHLERTGTINDTGGLSYIARLASETPSAANVETYAHTVRERSSLRRLKAIGDDIVKASTEPSEQTAAELIAGAQEQLQRLQSRARAGTGLIDVSQLIGELINDLDRRSEGPTGLRVGLPDFDNLTCGLESGDLVVIAARPGMGKTALLVSIAGTVSESAGVAVFSAEMPAQQLMRRCVALHAEIPQGLLRRAELLTNEHWPKINQACGAIGRKRLWIDETPAPTLAHIRAETLALKAREPLGLVLVDYVQLVRGLGANRYEQLRDVAYGLKALAKELGVPIIVLAQLNRGVEAREHKRPSVSDLRDSGAIEEAADIVGLLYSESYYDSAFSMPYVLECHIAKNRNGERGACLWRFDGAFSRVSALESGPTAEYRRLLSKSKKRTTDDL